MSGNILLLFLVFWPIAGAFAGYLIGIGNKNRRDYFCMMVTFVEFATVLSIFPILKSGQEISFQWIGFTGSRIYFVMDGFRLIYAAIAAFMWMMTTIFSHEYFSHYRNRNRYYLFVHITLGAIMGVLLSADLLTTFIFFEVMSFTSYVMVIHDEKEKALDAANTYMVIGVIGGLVLLMGIFLVQAHLGTTDMAAISKAMTGYSGDMRSIYLAGMLMMVGFGAKAGMFPMHIWLPNAHPAAPAPASALLSGILTKAGIYGALLVSSNMFLHNAVWGKGILIFGVITMFIGAFFAILSIDLKRTLAYSSVSQIGFILVGIGMQGILGEHGALAVRGTLLHMINHSIIKLVLFMAAGVVYMNLHELDLNKIKGFGKRKPALMLAFGLGVLAIIGMPFFSGYVSKTLLHESIVEEILHLAEHHGATTFFKVVEGIFILTGGMTTAYMTKLFIALFIEKNPYTQDKFDSLNGKYMSAVSMLTLLIPSFIFIAFGTMPRIMDAIATMGQGFMFGHDPAHAVLYFAWVNVKGAVASLSIGAILYVLVIRGLLMSKDEKGNAIYINPWPSLLDLEKSFYKPLLGAVLPFIGAVFARAVGSIPALIGKAVYWLYALIRSAVYSTLDIGVDTNNLGMEMAELHFESNGDHVNEGKPVRVLFGKILSSSLSFSLIEFASGLLAVLVIFLFIS